MATFDELMAALRKADAAGDTEGAARIAQMASQIKGAQPAPSRGASAVPQDAPSPVLPQDPVTPGGFDQQIIGLMQPAGGPQVSAVSAPAPAPRVAPIMAGPIKTTMTPRVALPVEDQNVASAAPVAGTPKENNTAPDVAAPPQKGSGVPTGNAKPEAKFESVDDFLKKGTISGYVSRVYDGDTFEISGKKVRLAALDCPEGNRFGGAKATALVTELTKDVIVTCELDGTTTYDRLVGYCAADGQDIGQAMISGQVCGVWEKFDSKGRYLGSYQGAEMREDNGKGVVPAGLISQRPVDPANFVPTNTKKFSASLAPGPVQGVEDPLLAALRGEDVQTNGAPVTYGASRDANDQRPPSDPFEGEGFKPLAKRRGQQFVRGATEVVASVPESVAITGEMADRTRSAGAVQGADFRAQLIADIDARLADPATPANERAILERNKADMTQGIDTLRVEAAQPIVPAQNRPVFAAGGQIRGAVTETVGAPDPRDVGFWAQAAEGSGNMAGMIAASAAGGLVGGPAGSLAVGGMTGSTMNQSQVFKEALDAGADQETALQASKWAAVIGAGEIIPINRALKILPPRLRGELATGFMRKFVDLAQASGEEAAQEYLSQVANNIAAQKLYDPERGWTEGATDAALVGAVLGAGVGGIGLALEGKPAAQNVTAPPRREEPPSDPLDQITAAMQPPAPDQAPTVPQPAQPGPQTQQTQQPADPLAQIVAAMTGQAPQSGQSGQTITRAEAEADPDRFEIVDEAEGQGANWRPTGAQVVIDKATGQAIPLAPDTAAANPAANAATEIAPDGFKLVHGGKSGLTLDAIEIIRTGQKQAKNGKKLGGFYAASEADADYAESYAGMVDGGTTYDVVIKPGTKILRKDGDITRLSEKQIADWLSQGIGIVVGKDPRGKTEYAVIDKNAIQSLDLRRLPSPPSSSGTIQPNDQGNQATGQAPEADVVAASGGVTPPAPAPNQSRNFEFVDAAGVQNIQTEPGVMQYKAGGDAEGVTDRLRGVTEWRPERAGTSIIYEYADGRRVIADGHQRLGLAKRLAGQGKAIQMPAMILRQADGVTPEDARVTAALKNIAEGSGTALDAAKVLRGTDKTPDQLGLPPSSAIVRDAMGMRNLSDQAFGMVINGVSSERDGGIVGRAVTDKAAQANILALLARMQKERPITAFQAESVARQAAADTVVETQDSLFGPEDDTKNLYLERAKILEAASKMKREEQSAFRNVIANADRLAAAGNQLDAEGNQTRLDSAAAMRDYLGREANTKGAISEALTAAARALNGGATVAAATRQFLDAVERELGARGSERQGGDRRGQAAGSNRPEESGDQGLASAGQDEAAADGDMFAPAQTGKTPDQVRAEAEAAVRAQQSKLRKPGGNSGDAGPLFNPDQDLFDPPKAKQADGNSGASFLATGATLRAELKAAVTEAVPLRKSTDLTEKGPGADLERRLAAATSSEERQQVAADFTLERGRQTGNEHLVFLGQDGALISLTEGDAKGVEFPDEAHQAVITGRVSFSVHNHPGNRGPSSADIGNLFGGVDPMVIVGHGGARHEMRRSEAAKNLKPADAIRAYKVMEARLVQLWRRDQGGASPDALNQQFHNVIVVTMERLGLIEYDGTAATDIKANGIETDDLLPSLFSAVAPGLRRSGYSVPESGDRGGNSRAGADATQPGTESAPRNPSGLPEGGDGAGRVPDRGLIPMAPPPTRATAPGKPAKASTGNAALDGALDDIFGDEADVPSPGQRVERDSGNPDPADSMGGADVPAAAGRDGRGGKGRTGPGGSPDREQSAGGGLPGGDAPPVGSGSDPGLDSAERPARKPASGRKRGAGDGNRAGGLPPDAGRGADPAGNASGAAPGKLTPAQQLAAIRGIFKEDVIDFVAGPERRRTDSDAFRKWFGDSQVVDKAGRPLVVYHGTDADFGAFDPSKQGKTDKGWFGRGLYLSADPILASGYAGNREGSNVIPVYVSAVNPWITTHQSFSQEYVDRLIRDEDIDAIIRMDRESDPMSKAREIVVFSPTQIKSIFNQGTWDASSPYMLREDAANPIDPRKAEALESIFVGALDGVNVKAASDRELFRSIILPLRDAGMTREEVAELTPYLESFLANLRAGRVGLAPEPAPRAIEADDRAAVQAKADRIKPVAADEANIRATLPLLLPEQQDDVLKVERRFAKPDGHGMMITNGTGTGKTFSGGGVIKRFVQMGKGDILIVAPSDAVIAGWTKALAALDVPVNQLRDTKDAGQAVTITTYANLRDNDALASRSFDLVVTDESQNLMSSKDGAVTGALQNLRAITHRPADLWRKSRMRHAKEWEAYKAMRDGEAKTAVYRRLKSREEAEVARWAQEPRSKVLFLSATPFAYDKAVDYAEGYLFDYPKDGHVGRSRQSGQNLFMVQHFGYRIRYHKLTKPEAAVDSAVFEREFHEKLKRDGVLSGRSLQVDVDYDRKFVLAADGLGTQIDAVLKHVFEGRKNPDKAIADGYQTLEREISQKFNYLKRMQLLEAIKARAAIPDIEKHLALGRKVVVFHDYNVGGGFNPFSNIAPANDANAIAAAADLMAAFPDLNRMKFASYAAPVDALLSALGKRARAFNGTVPQKKRLQNLADFNTDGSGADVLVVQSDAGGAGISMHDLTGTHQRVLINLGMPTKPTTTLQEEGRILRVGTQTNAPFRYYTIGTAWERRAFATRIAERSGTVENLALGNEARDLLTGFIEAYEEAEAIEPGPDDGKGGKERDRKANVTSPFEKAKTHYFGRTKTTGRRDQRDGIDFYPTPEPLALKMVEWAGIRPNERVLEPSAGDGAIARYVPDFADLTMVEPSSDLSSRALLKAPHGKTVESTFESYHLVNKAHVIVMNPPFGSGGATAMQHLAKAAKHLRAGGRIVALIPTGPSADKRFNAWWESDDAKGLSLSAEVALPAVAFERAGTNVMTRVVIIDKPAQGQDLAPDTQRLNFSGAGSINQFFDRLEQYDVRRRPDPVQDAIADMEAEGQDATAPMPQAVQGPALVPKGDAFKLAQVKHAKTGADLFVATIRDKVEREEYSAILAVAKQHGGYYSSFRGNGAVPGFQFKTEADRTAFLEDMAKPTVGFAEGGDAFGDDAGFAAQIMQELAQVDDLFQNPRSSGTTLKAVFADIDPSIAMGGRLAKDDPRIEEKDADEVFFGQTAKGKPFYVMQTGKEVWIDVSDLGQGDGGSRIYSAISDYALNTGKVFIGDPAGLSFKALRRRTDNMLSTALKHGTTRHIEPHPDQVAGHPDHGIPGLRWTEGDDAGNLASLIEVSVANLISLVPEVADARYDFQTGTFRTGDGQPLSDVALDKWSSAVAGSGAARIGRATLKRGVLLNTLARAESGERPGILERSLRQQRQLVAGGLRRTFYQVTPPQMVREAAAATEEISRLMPRLRAELDRLDLKRVRLVADSDARDWQGMFHVTGDGALEIVIGASMDPMGTLHHEVIHALRTMNLFTPEEWRALELAAERGWVKKHDIAARYPDLLPHEQIEEAIAEEFSEALAARKSPKGSALVTAFNKIARLFRAIRNVLSGAGYQTAEDIFGRILAGEISKRQAGNTGVRAAMAQRQGGSDPRLQRPQAVRPLSTQARAHRNTGMGGALFIPDRRVWEELTRATAPIWARLRNGAGGMSDGIDRARVYIQDRFLPVLRAQEAIERATGKRLPPEQRAYTAETTFSGKVGRHLFEVDEDFVKPIIRLIAASKGRLTAEAVGEWLYARHAIERNAKIASINPAMPDGGSGMTNAEAQQILADAAASPDAARLVEIGSLIDRLRERTLSLREDAGLITHDEASDWRKMYRHYVPLKGFAETDHAEAVLDITGIGKRFNVRGGESRRALGRKSEAFNPLQAAFTQAQEVAIRAEKNRVGQSLHELAKDYPSKALWEVKKPAQKRYFNRSTGLVETRVEDPVSMILAPNEMAVKISGEEHRIIFHDERLARAAGTVGADQMGQITRLLSMFSRFWSMTRTMLDPEFAVTNAFRDFQTAQFNIQAFGEGDKGAIAKAMLRDWRKALAGSWRAQGNRYDSVWAKHYREFQKAGAQVSFWAIEQPETAKEDLDRRVRLASGTMAARALKRLTSPRAILSMRDNPALAMIERANTAVDNAIRLAAFVEARKRGWAVEDAAFLAKELTVNFNRRGEVGANMNALYPFFNAAVQGSVRTVKALTSRRVALMAVTSIAAGMLNDLLNAWLSDEDDDGQLFYDKVPEYRNERNFHIVGWGTRQNPAAVPMPYGYNIFPYAGQNLGKVVRGVKSPSEAMGDVAAALFNAFSPVNGGSETTLVSPFFTDPLIEMGENADWTGTPIYPRYPAVGAPDSEVYFSGASEASKAIASFLNSATGGDFREAGWISVSPETIDHLSAFVTGSAGAFAGRTSDVLAKALKGDVADIGMRDIPFLRRLTSPVGPWIDRDQFYSAKAAVQDANADVKAYAGAGQVIPPDRQALADLYDDMLAAELEMNGKGDWNPNKPGALTPRPDSDVMKAFNRKYLIVMGKVKP